MCSLVTLRPKRTVLSFRTAKGRDRYAGLLGELVQNGRAGGQLAHAQGFQHAVTELEGAGGGHHHGGGSVTSIPPVLVEHVKGHGGVGINQVTVLLPHAADGLLCLIVVAETGGEELLQPALDGGAHLIPPGPGQLLHVPAHLGVIVVGQGRRAAAPGWRRSGYP